MMTDYIVETENLCKIFTGKVALDSLNLRLKRGGVHAIVGSNGAGKSTLFKILLGILSPTSGRAHILGIDSSRLSPADRARIGFVNEEHTLPGWMSVAALSRCHRNDYPQWNHALYQDMIGNINVRPTQKIAQLSRGERAGLNLAIALAQSPELLILDEPTLGLDVVAKKSFSTRCCSATRSATVPCSIAPTRWTKSGRWPTTW